NWADGGAGLASIVANKQRWTGEWETAVDRLYADAAEVVRGLVETPADEDRVLVFNPLGFTRTDVVDVPGIGSGPWVVTDVATGAEVPGQVVAGTTLRFLASDVPSLGYRVYRYAAGTGVTSWPPAAVVSGATIDNGHYRVRLGSRGQI